ncbi:hypothetical protein ACWD5V_40090 [Streptomyces sp. NPDC002523]
MGWGEVRGTRRSAGPTWAREDLSAAAAFGAAQLPAAGLLAWILVNTAQDDYRAGIGGALGAVCVVVFGVPMLPVLGVLTAFVLTLPAVVLARLAARRLRGPGWLWHVVAPIVPALFWGAPAALLFGWSPIATTSALAVFGLLPTLWVGLARRLAWRPARMWWCVLPASLVLLPLAFGGGALATVTGLVREYEPPKLTPAQLAGVWRGDSGAELRLRPDGGARAVKLPGEPPFDDDTHDHGHFQDYVVCAGSGTWRPDADTGDTDRDGVLLTLDGDCGEDTRWTIGGSADDPELFVLFGDPDAGSLRILKRAG